MIDSVDEDDPAICFCGRRLRGPRKASGPCNHRRLWGRLNQPRRKRVVDPDQHVTIKRVKDEQVAAWPSAFRTPRGLLYPRWRCTQCRRQWSTTSARRPDWCGFCAHREDLARTALANALEAIFVPNGGTDDAARSDSEIREPSADGARGPE